MTGVYLSFAFRTTTPLRFSSSALLRPVIQDSLLPTAAYVGGPGEINYFAQLGPLYELFGVAQPLVLPRARFRCLEDNTRSWLAKLGLSPAEAEVPRAELVKHAFVLRPMADVAPGLVHPQLRKTLAELWRVFEGDRQSICDTVDIS